MERPLTVAGLIEKRDELVKLRDQLLNELEAVTFDIDHVVACIWLFDPAHVSPLRRRTQSSTMPRVAKWLSYVLQALRTTSGPLTARQIGLAWAKDNGVDASETTALVLRKRVGSCLRHLQAKELVTGAGESDDAKLWVISTD